MMALAESLELEALPVNLRDSSSTGGGGRCISESGLGPLF